MSSAIMFYFVQTQRNSIYVLMRDGRAIFSDASRSEGIAYLARIEQRKPVQIASLALRFCVKLPPEAHAAIRQIEALRSPSDFEAATKEVTRALLHIQYQVAHRSVIDQMRVKNLDRLKSEEDILTEAVALTR